MKITLKNVCLDYASQRVLHEINLNIQQGERVAIVGASGAGKTSLLRLLATALRPTSGDIELSGQQPWQVPRRTLRHLRSRIGMVYQASVLPPRQRVITAVLAGKLGQWSFWKSVASLIYPQDIEGARVQLAKLNLADKLFARCDHLSGGQQQRVAVARTLYQSPDLILADEPVASIDPVLAERVIEVLVREAENRQVTLVASLHAVDLALTWFSRVVGIKAGNIAFDLPANQISAKQLHELYVGRDELKDESVFTRDVSAILRQSIC